MLFLKIYSCNKYSSNVKIFAFIQVDFKQEISSLTNYIFCKDTYIILYNTKNEIKLYIGTRIHGGEIRGGLIFGTIRTDIHLAENYDGNGAADNKLSHKRRADDVVANDHEKKFSFSTLK